jgi:hypothetical protein
MTSNRWEVVAAIAIAAVGIGGAVIGARRTEREKAFDAPNSPALADCQS